MNFTLYYFREARLGGLAGLMQLSGCSYVTEIGADEHPENVNSKISDNCYRGTKCSSLFLTSVHFLMFITKMLAVKELI